MKRSAIMLLCACWMIVPGCGTQSILLGTKGSYLLTVMDSLAVPNEQIQLRARFQGGDLLRPRVGYVLRFWKDGKLFKVAETDEDGVAAVSFTPKAPGDYRFTVDVAQAHLSTEPPEPQELLIASHDADSPMVIVDLDKTLVSSGFQTVLIGNPTEMPQSPEVLQRLSKTHAIVYLTHRPDYFGPKSKAWLTEHNYPTGPVLLSNISGFLKGSATYKTEEIAKLKRRFRKIEIGIGDKVSDARAYYENGLKSFLIIQIPGSDDRVALEALADEIETLPAAVQVVTDWKQIQKALFHGASFRRETAVLRLRQIAETSGDKPSTSTEIIAPVETGNRGGVR